MRICSSMGRFMEKAMGYPIESHFWKRERKLQDRDPSDPAELLSEKIHCPARHLAAGKAPIHLSCVMSNNPPNMTDGEGMNLPTGNG